MGVMGAMARGGLGTGRANRGLVRGVVVLVGCVFHESLPTVQ